MIEALRQPDEDAVTLAALLRQASFLHGSPSDGGRMHWQQAAAWLARAVRRRLAAHGPDADDEDENGADVHPPTDPCSLDSGGPPEECCEPCLTLHVACPRPRCSAAYEV